MFIELNTSFRTVVDDPTTIASDGAKLVPSATSLKWAVVDFKGLVEALQESWVALSPSLPTVVDILVIGIDLTTRVAVAT